MASKQRTFKPNITDDDNLDGLISPCLQISSDIELKEIPTNGEEYLLKVMKERENYAVVTKCNEDYSRFAKNQSRFIEEVPCAPVPAQLKPTIEWQNIQVADFSDVRMYISKLISKKSSWPKNVREIEIDYTLTDRWKSFFDKNEPTLTCVLGLKHTLLDRGLEVLIEMLKDIRNGDSIDHKTGQWIYAFLACTRQPLLSETTSILRDLARRCAEIRSNLNPDTENALLEVAPLNLFICLVSRYFRQYDLADQ